MHTGHVVHLFEGKRSHTVGGVKAPGLLGRAWKRVANFAVAVVEVVRESRELQRRLLNQPGHHRFFDS